MRYYHKTLNKFYCPTVNVDRLWSLVSEQTREKYQKETEKAPVIDCVRAVSTSFKRSFSWPGLIDTWHA
jgi:large subunit ribosomal protein L27Ae